MNKFLCFRIASKLIVVSFNRTVIERFFVETNSYVLHHVTSKHQYKTRQFSSQSKQVNKQPFFVRN